MKTGIIVNCELTGEWPNPNGATVYYHRLTLDNGEVGNVGVMEKYSSKIRQGTLIQYTIDAKNKIKILSNTVANSNEMINKTFNAKSTTGTAKKTYGQSPKTPEDFLGFTWGYAKDLVVAGKTMADMEELNKMARYIYDQVKDMLKNQDSEDKNQELPLI